MSEGKADDVSTLRDAIMELVRLAAIGREIEYEAERHHPSMFDAYLSGVIARVGSGDGFTQLDPGVSVEDITRGLALLPHALKVASVDLAHLNTNEGGFICLSPALAFALGDLRRAVRAVGEGQPTQETER